MEEALSLEPDDRPDFKEIFAKLIVFGNEETFRRHILLEEGFSSMSESVKEPAIADSEPKKSEFQSEIIKPEKSHFSIPYSQIKEQEKLYAQCKSDPQIPRKHSLKEENKKNESADGFKKDNLNPDEQKNRRF